MTLAGLDGYRAVLTAACRQVGLDDARAEPMRLGENALFRLPGGLVARVARPGQQAVAAKEVQVAKWLSEQDIPAVRPWTDPIVIGETAVTIWHQLPRHRPGRYPEVAATLRRLHHLPPPDFLAPLTPFVRTAQRIDQATTLTVDDRTWLRDRLSELEGRYANDLPDGLPLAVVHGDAYGGNIVVTEDEQVPVLLDLERASVGPPEWDLTSTAVHRGFGWISHQDYAAYCTVYGYDVTTWDGYALLRDIRELRITTWMAQLAVDQPKYRDEARLRVACLRGERGPRPWPWSAA
jgi:aminoglycoside phosphotransferase